jgi:hypothetical protein
MYICTEYFLDRDPSAFKSEDVKANTSKQIHIERYVVNSNSAKLDWPSPSQFTRLTAMFYPCFTVSNSKPYGT